VSAILFSAFLPPKMFLQSHPPLIILYLIAGHSKHPPFRDLSESDVRTQRDACYAKLGFCPQFDGLLDVLTGREHLRMYAQLKGVAADAQEALIEVRTHGAGRGDECVSTRGP
jgi:hypothetical protein